MFSLPPFFSPSAVSARILNKLLQREEWARDRLGRQSGKSVRFVLGGFKAALVIQSSGLVQASDAAVVPDVVLTIPLEKLAELPAILRSRDASAIAAVLHIEGDAGLAQVVSDLARDLRWDVEDDLSRLVGDMAATRLLGAGKLLADGARNAADRLAGNVGEYLSEESGMMASRSAFNDWTTDVGAIARRLDALDARIGKLAGAVPRSSDARHKA